MLAKYIAREFWKMKIKIPEPESVKELNEAMVDIHIDPQEIGSRLHEPDQKAGGMENNRKIIGLPQNVKLKPVLLTERERQVMRVILAYSSLSSRTEDISSEEKTSLYNKLR